VTFALEGDERKAFGSKCINELVFILKDNISANQSRLLIASLSFLEKFVLTNDIWLSCMESALISIIGLNKKLVDKECRAAAWRILKCYTIRFQEHSFPILEKHIDIRRDFLNQTDQSLRGAGFRMMHLLGITHRFLEDLIRGLQDTSNSVKRSALK